MPFGWPEAEAPACLKACLSFTSANKTCLDDLLRVLARTMCSDCAYGASDQPFLTTDALEHTDCNGYHARQVCEKARAGHGLLGTSASSEHDFVNFVPMCAHFSMMKRTLDKHSKRNRSKTIEIVHNSGTRLRAHVPAQMEHSNPHGCLGTRLLQTPGKAMDMSPKCTPKSFRIRRNRSEYAEV